MKTQVKHLETALTGGDVEKAGVEFQATVKKLDKMASKGILHKKTAARKKSRLAKQLNALKAKKSS
jgi:small subunit ribosomal protein S20